MYINHEAKTIVITKAENKAASTIGSEMDKALGAQMERFPSYTVRIEKEKKTRDYLDRINFEFMEAYIKAKGDANNLKIFYTKRGLDENAERINSLIVEDFFSIREWFFDEYKEVKNYAEQIKEMKAQRKAAKEAEKMSKRVEEMKKMIAIRESLDAKVA